MKSKATSKNDYSKEHIPKLDRALVVMSPDLVEPGAAEESALIRRAIALAKATGCELELFHVCHDDSFTRGFFADDKEVLREQVACVDRGATLMTELVVRLKADGVKISQDTRWDAPRTDAILRKINETQPDLVMKQSRDHKYVMGLMANTDWDLIRQSPAHLWFVNDEGTGQIGSLVTAIGASMQADEIIAGADYDVFRLANLIAEGFQASNTPVHAYQTPVGLSTYAAYVPELGGVSYPPTSALPSAEEVRQSIARKHGESIAAFASFFHIEPKCVRVTQGHPSDVLTAAASELKASLIVMAARNLSRWERWSQSVTAEPVLSATQCDVVFVKDPGEATIAKAEELKIKGVPTYDLERAVIDPGQVFGSPDVLGNTSEISVPLRKRILEIWRQDIRAQMAEENEGGPVRVTRADLLAAINNAQEELISGSEKPAKVAAALTQ